MVARPYETGSDGSMLCAIFTAQPISRERSRLIQQVQSRVDFFQQALNLIALFWAGVSLQPFDELLFLL
jgi:hypothetical protein